MDKFRAAAYRSISLNHHSLPDSGFRTPLAWLSEEGGRERGGLGGEDDVPSLHLLLRPEWRINQIAGVN